MKTKKAFTLVEMLIVIVIIGILAATLIPKIMGAQKRARDVKRVSDIRQIGLGLETLIYSEGTMPTTQAGVYTSTEEIEDAMVGYLKSIPTDKNDNGLVVRNDDGDCITQGKHYAYYYNEAKQQAIVTASMETGQGNTNNCRGVVSGDKGFSKYSDGYNIEIDNTLVPSDNISSPTECSVDNCPTWTNLSDIISDANFRAVIVSEVGGGKQEGDITQADLDSITILNRSNQNINSIKGVSYLKNLNWLILQQNNITDVPSEIGNLSNLEILNLGQNNITNIPPEIGNLSNLSQLYLLVNNINTIPPEIGNLSSLTILDMMRNNINIIPSEIGNLSQITTLTLRDNNITIIPSEVGNLSNLTHLQMQSNNISQIAPEVANISSLSHFTIQNNNMSTIPARQNGLPSLSRIYLGGNDVSFTCNYIQSQGWNVTNYCGN